MKHVAKLLTLALLLLLIPATALGADEAAGDTPIFLWKDQTWTLRSVTVNPEHIIDNPTPEADHYVLVRFECLTGSVPIADVIQSLEFIKLKADGEAYAAAAYMPYYIAYNDRNGVFMTAPEQGIFDLFFIVPVATDIASLTLSIEGEEMCCLIEIPIEGA